MSAPQIIDNAHSPIRELIAYETLWANKSASVKSIGELFRKSGKLPSEIAGNRHIPELETYFADLFSNPQVGYNIGFMHRGHAMYPARLGDTQHHIEGVYYSGDLSLLSGTGIAIVGTRKPSADGVLRAKKMAKLLVGDGLTIVSGLAEGIDTAAHQAAIENGGRTIAVIGTPLHKFYPKSNSGLQQFIAQHHLLLSQVPFYHYQHIPFTQQKLFFAERNKMMSALSHATIIIEAGATSGTLIQGKAALDQGRKLFILDSCFGNTSVEWPVRFQEKGAIRVKAYDDILKNL